MCSDTIFNEHRTKLINEIIKNENFTKYDIKIESGSSKGDNYVGILYRVSVTGVKQNGTIKKLSLIVKCAPQLDVVRDQINTGPLFKREGYIYSTVLPEFRKLASEKHLTNNHLSNLARCYKVSNELLNETLVFEDMNQRGFVMYDRRKPMDYEHCKLVMEQLGRFHAYSFAMRDQQPELFERISRECCELIFVHMDKGGIVPLLNKGAPQRLLVLDEVKDAKAFEKFKKMSHNLGDKLVDILKPEQAGKYGVICHGDCWINNFLFKYSENGRKPVKMCFLDWQLSRASSPAIDISYLIWCSTDKSMREQYYDQLLQDYYESFSNFLQDLGSNAKDLFPFEILQQHLKKFSILGLGMAILALHLFLTNKEDAIDLETLLENEQEYEHKIDHLLRNDKIYRQRMGDIIRDMSEKDYL